MSNKAMSNETGITVPDGCMMNEKGHFVPVDKVDAIDKLRDETVVDIFNSAKTLSEQVAQTKKQMFAKLFDFFDLSAMEYEREWRNPKGNVSVPSFCGRYKVQLSVSKYLDFDERLNVAKDLTDECISEWSEGSNDYIKELVLEAFKVDTKGNLSAHKLLGLLKYKFDNAKWEKAMKVLREAVHVVGSKEYLRFYQRDEHGKYHQLLLDFSKL